MRFFFSDVNKRYSPRKGIIFGTSGHPDSRATRSECKPAHVITYLQWIDALNRQRLSNAIWLRNIHPDSTGHHSGLLDSLIHCCTSLIVRNYTHGYLWKWWGMAPKSMESKHQGLAKKSPPTYNEPERNPNAYGFEDQAIREWCLQPRHYKRRYAKVAPWQPGSFIDRKSFFIGN